MNNQAGKGDTPRPVDRKKWDSSPLWDKIGPDKKADKEKRTQIKGRKT